MRVVTSLRRELHIDFSISDFMAGPTIDGVAGRCARRAAAPPVLQALPADWRRYPCSRAQRRTLDLLAAMGDSGSTASIAILISGDIDAPHIQRAWQQMLARHPLLYADISKGGNQERPASGSMLELKHIRSTLPVTRTGFMPHAGPADTLSATLLSDGERTHVLFIEARHAAVDGGSVPVLLREFAQACTIGAPLPPSADTSYQTYVASEAAWLDSPAHATAIAYWQRYLHDASRPVTLPAMLPDHGEDYASRRFGFSVTGSVKERLLVLARAQQCTPFAAMLAAFSVLLHRYTLADDMLIGVPTALRDLLGMEGVVGPTLNALPFRARVAAVDTFSVLMQRTQQSLSAALEHAVLPWEQIAATCQSLRETRGVPLPIQVVAQEAPSYQSEDGEVLITELPARNGDSPVALLVGVLFGKTMRVEFEYRRAILSDGAAIGIAKAFRLLVRELVTAPHLPVSQARMLSHTKVFKALEQRPLQHSPGMPMMLHHGLEAGARRHPERIAVVSNGQGWTFARLDKLANRHAHRLRDAGLLEGGHVIIASRKGIDEVVAVLATLKAGGVYIPIDWDTPAARALALASRTEAQIITGSAELATDFGHPERFVFIGVDIVDAAPAAAPMLVTGPEATAYILFTSGSTGEPKGVEVSHAAALCTIGEMLRRFNIGASDVFYGLSAIGFDLSVFDVFGALAAGACLVLPLPAAKVDPFVWMEDVDRHQVTIWNSVPSSLDMLLEASGTTRMPSLRRLLVSGDWVGLDLPPRAHLACPGAQFVALGGATEASIWSNCQVITGVDPAWRSIPYGRALDGQSMFVAEPGGWPAPAGVIGEICIGGAGLAKGYFGDPVLTGEKFVTHPQTGRRIYRTGDLGRYFADGAIEFIGRRDRQIKLRGHRIETGDIEAALSACAGVRRTLVKVTAGAIVAYVQAEDGAALASADLRFHAERQLPYYMRPVHYCLVDNFPLTANGKIDWAGLRAPALGSTLPPEDAQNEFSELERRVAGLWRELLPAVVPGRDDNFFLLGGDSLLAVKLVTRVRREFGHHTSLPAWLAEPTVAHMARMLLSTDGPLHAAGARPVRTLRKRVRIAGDLVFATGKRTGTAVFVTGATGLIGSRLVARYLSHTSCELVCLVRNEADTNADGRLPCFLRARGISEREWQSRVRFVYGNLELRQFGLSDAAFEALAAQTGTVFHVGANVNLVASYEALEAANVLGTHEAIRLASLAGASLQFVSSVGVLPYGVGRTVMETDSIDFPGPLLTGYCESKWVAEQTVRLAAERGLRATVYRPGLTLDDSAANEYDLLALLLALTGPIGALPDLAIPVDISTADYVAAAMVQLAADERSAGATFHLTHPEPAPFRELVRLANLGMPMVTFETWRARLELLLPSIADPRAAALGAMIVAQNEADITPARIDCSITTSLLHGSGIECLPVADIVLQRMLGANLWDSPA